jgi:multidrug efflux pump
VNPSALFLRRPKATALLAIALALAGIAAYKLLPVASLPEIDMPVISVSAQFPGAEPSTMASSVATPLERQFGKIAGLNEMTSASFLGSTSIVLQFDLSRDVNAAERDVEAAINAAAGQLPADMPSEPTFRKVNPSDAPIVVIGLTSKTLNTGQIYDAATTVIQQKLSQLPGVGQVVVGEFLARNAHRTEPDDGGALRNRPRTDPQRSRRLKRESAKRATGKCERALDLRCERSDS